MEFNLPDIGEGITVVTVTDILVKSNQSVKKDDIIIIVESEKASMEIPINENCTIDQLSIKVGQNINPGQLLLTTIDDSNELNNKVSKEETKLYSNNITKVTQKEETELIQDTAVLEDEIPSIDLDKQSKQKNNIIYASPSVRKLARELNCDLNIITGTGNNGRITLDDIQNNSNQINTTISKSEDTDQIFNTSSKWGLSEKVELNTIKITTGKRLHESWTTIPHVTQFDECDITSIDNIRRVLKSRNKDKSIQVSFIPFFIKAVSIVLHKLPIFNTSLSKDSKYIIQKKYYNIGIAVDTQRGLVVPVLKNVANKSIKQISKELSMLIMKAKNKRLTIEDMSGGCFTISSLGGISGKFFTPIINPPEVAILGLSKIDTKPVFINNKFKPRKILPISLSYDHRVIDGADAARFTKLFSEIISNPRLLND